MRGWLGVEDRRWWRVVLWGGAGVESRSLVRVKRDLWRVGGGEEGERGGRGGESI